MNSPSPFATRHQQAGSALQPTAGTALRILIADDHDLVRETLAAFLSVGGACEVTCAGNLDEAVRAASGVAPFDVVLLDYNMPGMSGLDGLDRMRRANMDRPVALISGTATPALAEAAIAEGAAGFLPKTMPAKSILAAIRFMAAGEIYAPYDFLHRPNRARDSFGLTERERDVLRGLAVGKANKEIARDLDLQEVTVKLHVKTLSRKLGAKNRTQAAMLARDHDLV
jgi:DNA-binding NarL/FixJ family response regulator